MNGTIGPENRYLSPVAVALVISGIVLCAIFPPLGVVAMLAALGPQRRFRRRYSRRLTKVEKAQLEAQRRQLRLDSMIAGVKAL